MTEAATTLPTTAIFTAEMTPAELARCKGMWAKTASIAARNPIIAATRRAMERTEWRVGTSIERGAITVILTAFNIRNGFPTGVGKVREIARFQIGETDKVVAFLDTLESPVD